MATQQHDAIMRDNLLIMHGGFLTIRDRQYIVCPRNVNHHHVDASAFFKARSLGLATLGCRNVVKLTKEGWAFCDA